MRLGDIMTKRVERVSPSDTPERARNLMRLHRIRHLVVTVDHRIAGLLAEDDLITKDADAAVSVEPLMTRRFVTAPPDLTVRKAANLLRGSNVGALPVVKGGRLVGIVTVSDLLELVGKGSERPVQKGRRWILRDRGIRPKQARAR
jgi:CBS domain-containing protein